MNVVTRFQSTILHSILAGIALVAMLGSATVLAHTDHTIAASTPSSSSNKIKELEEEITAKDQEVQNLEKKSERLQGQIVEAQESQKTLANQLLVFDTQIEQVENELEVVTQKIEAKKLQIEKKQLEIDEVERNIHEQKKVLADLVQRLHEYDSTTTLELFLGFDNFSDFLNTADQVRALEERSHEILGEIKTLRRSLTAEEALLQEERRALDDYQNEQQDSLDKLEASRRSKAFLLEKTEADEEKFLALVEDAERLKAVIASEQAQLRSDLAAAIEEAKQAETIPESTGLLGWPVNPHPLTAYFKDPAYYSLFGFHHTGLDIDGETGDSILAADNGIIVGATSWTPDLCVPTPKPGRVSCGYGNYIDVLHAGGVVTRYAHLSSISVVKGQTVSKGQKIGAMGSTGFSTGSHLHFEVRVNDGATAVDPLQYL